MDSGGHSLRGNHPVGAASAGVTLSACKVAVGYKDCSGIIRIRI